MMGKKIIVFLELGGYVFSLVHPSTLHEGKEIDHELLVYHYEQHTCPTNFLTPAFNGIMHLSDRDTDPHGAFTYYGAIMAPDNMGQYGDIDINVHLPRLSYRQQIELVEAKEMYNSFDKWENYIDENGNYLDRSGSIFDVE